MSFPCLSLGKEGFLKFRSSLTALTTHNIASSVHTSQHLDELYSFVSIHSYFREATRYLKFTEL